MEDQIIVEFHHVRRGERTDLEIPADLTANELVQALNVGLSLGIRTNDLAECYLKATNPIALIKGTKTLRELGLRDGTEIWFDR